MKKMNDKNSILDDLLGEEKIFSSNEEEDSVLQPMLDEINLIQDQSIKSFVRSILLQAKTFWIIPSSFSGKYHPSDEHNSSGNMLHTKRVVRAAKVLSDSYTLGTSERDLVYAACLLHDVTKGVCSNGDSDDSSFVYDPLHPYTVGMLVKKCQENDKKYASESSSSTLYVDEDTVQAILRLVRCHLGPWSPVPETTPVTYLDTIVHLADNIASKVHYVVDGDNVIEDRWKF
jgi:hypothetical protein